MPIRRANTNIMMHHHTRPLATIIAGPSSVRRPTTHSRRGYRKFIFASLAVIVLSLVVYTPIVSAAPGKTCMEVKEDYDVRNAARDSNVFLIVDEKENKEAREALCKKLESTPGDRLKSASDKGKGAVFAYLEIKDGEEDLDGVWQDGNRGFVKNSLGVKSFPSFLFVSKGMDGFSKYANHITHYKGSGDNSLDMSEVEKFIENKVGFRLGNDVYNIIFFDTLASRFVSYGDATGVDRIKQHCLSLLVRVSTLFSWKEPFTTIGKLYNRAFAMSFEHGMDYCEKQVDKLQKRLETNKDDITEEKSHEFQQKIAILKAFSEPKELTPEDDKQIFIHAMLHIGLIVATILLFIIPSDEEEEDGGEEVINAEPVIAKPVDDDTSSKKRK